MHGTNPLKVKEKIKITLKSSDAVHASTIKVDEKPAFVKNYMKSLNSVVALANTGSRSVMATSNISEDNRYTLDGWKLYLDSCATYHSFFVGGFL